MEPAAAADRRQTIERPRSTGARIAIRAQLRKLALRRALFFPRLGTTRLRKVIPAGGVFYLFCGEKRGEEARKQAGGRASLVFSKVFFEAHRLSREDPQ